MLYIGTDGKLYAEWWTGSTEPITSNTAVDDDLWHHAILATNAAGTKQTLTIDGVVQASSPLNGTVNLAQTTPTDLTFGTGYIGASWPNEKYNGDGGTPCDYGRSSSWPPPARSCSPRPPPTPRRAPRQ